MKKTTAILAAMIFCLLMVDSVRAQATEFTYQGQLQASALPASGNFDFEFLLFDSPIGGSQVGSTVTRSGVAVANGIFSVNLDFGSSFPGSNRFLEIRVKQSGGGAFVSLNPRQPITSSPYSVKSLTADTATNAVTAVNATAAATATSFSGPLAGDVTGTQGSTTVARLQGRNVSNTAPLNDQVLKFNTATNQWLPGTDNTSGGGGNAILNQTTQQAGANFNISGDGTAGGTLTGNVVNAATQFNIGGRVLTIGGSANLFVGLGAGGATPNTSGFDNTFVGSNAGGANAGSSLNSFFGARAGLTNTTGGGNTFLGRDAGIANTTGVSNTAIGFSSNVGSGGLSFATALGAGSVVSTNSTVVLGRPADTVQVPGNLVVAGTFTGNINGASITNLNASNISTGTLDNARLGVVPVANGGTGSATQNFVDLTTAQTIAGNKTFSGTLSGNVVNATTQYNLGVNRILAVGSLNSIFLGVDAGINTTGNANSFFGFRAGQLTTTGVSNSFFGTGSGEKNVGSANSFFGDSSGAFNTTGGENTFFGTGSGVANTTGSTNSFFGKSSGSSNSSGTGNVFVGLNAGFANTTGNNNVFVGRFASNFTGTGTNNTVIGDSASVSTNGLDHATAIGAGAVVSASNTVALGRAADTVQVPGTFIGAGKVSGGVVNSTTQYNINDSRVVFATGSNLFVGIGTGASNTGSANSFFGQSAGAVNTSGPNNSFFGSSSGSDNTTGGANSFFGSSSGSANTTGSSNSFFGRFTGIANTTGSENTFVGSSAGTPNTTGSFNSFLGVVAGFSNTTGSNNVFIGRAAGSTNTIGDNNTTIGFNSNVASNNLTFATAIGAGAVVSASNTVVLGRASDAVVVPGPALDVNGPVTSTRSGVPLQSIEINGGNGSSIRLTAQSAAAADKPLVIQNLSAEAVPTANNNMQFQVGTTASPSTKMTIDSAGNVGIGTTTPNDKLEVNGSIRVTTLGAAGATTLCRNASNQISTCSSSARYKSNITPFGFGLSLVRQLRPVSFTWKDGGMLDMGLVAEEVNAVEPLLTNLNDNGLVVGVKYDRVGVILVNAVKEQQAQIEAQQKLIDQQRVENEELKARILAIEKALAKRP